MNALPGSTHDYREQADKGKKNVSGAICLTSVMVPFLFMSHLSKIQSLVIKRRCCRGK